MAVKVIIAVANMLFADGLAKLLEGEKDLTVTQVIPPGEECGQKVLEKMDSHIILADFTSLYNAFPDLERAAKKPHFILIDTGCGKENLISAVLNKRVSGVLLCNSSPDLMLKAIRAVSTGEIWLDKQTFKNILHGINAIGGERNSLSKRENEVVTLIGRGLRNKEIASRLHISETTVKTHVNRIFQKLNLKARSELISYAIKNHSHIAGTP